MDKVWRLSYLSGFLFVPLILLCPLPSLAASGEEVRDWPCRSPLRERAPAEEIWGGPLPAPLPTQWRRDPTIRSVVEYAANPENRPDQGVRRIARFAETPAADRSAALLAVYAGLLEETDVLRGFLIEGIRQYVLRAKILQESVRRHAAALAALPEDGGASGSPKRHGLERARLTDARQLDDAMEEAEFLCLRYAYLDKKLRLLTEAIRETN
jgi:hypothetical protein